LERVLPLPAQLLGQLFTTKLFGRRDIATFEGAGHEMRRRWKSRWNQVGVLKGRGGTGQEDDALQDHHGCSGDEPSVGRHVIEI